MAQAHLSYTAEEIDEILRKADELESVTSEEKESWNNKADKEYVDNLFNTIVNGNEVAY